MKKYAYVLICLLVISVLSGISSAQVQQIDGYTVIRTGASSMVCLGRWIPSSEPGKPGTCEGQMMDVSQLSAVSSKQTVEKLDQVIIFLAAIDQKLAENISQTERLLELLSNTEESISRQAEQGTELLRNNITTRFESLSRRVMSSETFRKEIERLREEILEELKKYNSGRTKQ